MASAAEAGSPAAPLSQTQPSGKTRVLIVDDSVVMRRIITRILTDDPAFELVGTARDGVDALAKVELHRPHVVTLDVEMPELDGIAALRLIRKRFPSVRVIMLSSLTARGTSVTIDALMEGASDYVTKPDPGSLSGDRGEALGEELKTKIKQLFQTEATPAAQYVTSVRTPVIAPRFSAARMAPEVLAIGTSTGGPPALAEIIPKIPRDFPLPILIVQHMPPHFTKLLADRLAKISNIEVMEASHGMRVRPGCALIAPGNYHMQVVKKAGHVEIALDQQEPENSCRPAVDVLFRSIARVYGAATIATILTGMGQDGLLGVKELKRLGAPVLAQDKATSVVWGMPGAVVEAMLADTVVPLNRIIPEVLNLCRR